MIKPLRKRHFQIWTAWAVLVPIGIISAVLVRPESPKDKLLQPVATAALPIVLKSIDRDNYTISIRSNSDSSQLQLEWINKKTLTYPTTIIYQVSKENNLPKVSPTRGDLEGAVSIGRIEARGTYYFKLRKSIDTNYHLILYDFIHNQIIDSITF